MSSSRRSRRREAARRRALPLHAAERGRGPFARLFELPPTVSRAELDAARARVARSDGVRARKAAREWTAEHRG